MERVEQWINRVTGGDSGRAIADASGLNHATLSRQRNTSTVTPGTVEAIARAYGADLIPGLMALGLVTEGDLRAVQAALTLDQVSDEELADEVLRRMRAGSEVMNAPISEAVDTADFDLAARESDRPILRARMDDQDEGA